MRDAGSRAGEGEPETARAVEFQEDLLLVVGGGTPACVRVSGEQQAGACFSFPTRKGPVCVDDACGIACLWRMAFFKKCI